MNKPDFKWRLSNQYCSVEIERHGGNFTSFTLNDSGINPLSFRMQRPASPAYENESEFFTGHFLCAGRWGDPSSGEQAKSILKHGDISTIEWKLISETKSFLSMTCTSHRESISVKREITLDSNSTCFLVEETFTNIGNLSRLFNLVQHPTIAMPFLNNSTIVDCNASDGFRNLGDNLSKTSTICWPHGLNENGQKVNISIPQHACSGVYSFTVDKHSKLGWITAYSQDHNLLLAYIWQRKNFPWINMWIHFENNMIKYRGLEFGTTCIHQPYKEIFENNLWKILEENTCLLLDAGEKTNSQYIAFIIPIAGVFKGVKEISLHKDGFEIEENLTSNKFLLQSTLNLT